MVNMYTITILLYGKHVYNNVYNNYNLLLYDKHVYNNYTIIMINMYTIMYTITILLYDKHVYNNYTIIW